MLPVMYVVLLLCLLLEHACESSVSSSSLGVVIPTQVLPLDKHVRNGPLPGHFSELALDFTTTRAHLVQLNDKGIGCHAKLGAKLRRRVEGC